MSNQEYISDQRPIYRRIQDVVSWLCNNPKKLWLVEVGLAFLISIILSVLFSLYAPGGPNSSDITLYMNIGLNGIATPFVLNRYFHIFLQQIFVSLAAHPLDGFQMFWGAQVGLNAFLVYIASRKIFQNSTLMHGVLSVLMFFSLSALAEFSGIVVVDMTAMTLMLAVFTIYIFSLNAGHKKSWLVAVMGFMMFLAFKTKETTLPVAIVFIGLGWVDGAQFSWKRLLKNLFWVLCGVLGGVIFFGIISWIFLGDPFFGLRVHEWQEFRATYAVYSSRVLETMIPELTDDWYQGYWFEWTFLPFLLYIISAVNISRKGSLPRKLLWVAPLAFILLLIVTINNRLGYLQRLGMPILSILCVLAPQFIDLNWPGERRRKIAGLILLGVGLILVFGIRLLIQRLVTPTDLHLGSVNNLMYYPILLTLLLASVFLFRDHLIWNIFNGLIVLSLLLSPLSSNYRSMFVVRENYQAFQSAIEPFSEFEDSIEFFPEMRVYVIDMVFSMADLALGKNEDEVMALFNIYFNASSERENFVFVAHPADIVNDILAEHFDYVFLTDGHWAATQEEAAVAQKINALYQPHFSTDNRIVLLTQRE